MKRSGLVPHVRRPWGEAAHGGMMGISRLHRLAAYAACPLVMIAVASYQIHMAYFRQLATPAKGGGFGLFSTVDKLNNRLFRAEVLGDDWQRVLLDPGAHKKTVRRATSAPTDRNLRAAARALAGESQRQFGPIRALRIEVWKRQFDSKSLQASRLKLRELMVGKTEPSGD